MSLFADAGAELICQSEPTSSGDLISPRMFKNLVVPFLKRTNDEISSKVLVRMTHICGNTNKIVDYINEINTNLFSVDYKVDMQRAKLSEKTVIAGNINPVETMLKGSAVDVKNKAQRCCQMISKGGDYILMPGCDIPASTPLENILAIVETAHNFKYYRKTAYE